MGMSSDQYFTPQPTSPSAPTTHEVTVRKQRFVLAGDRGVFNRGDLDWGTRVLIENAEDRKSTRLNSSHVSESRMPSSA